MFVRRRRKKGSKSFGLILTPMIDMFIALIVFLLKIYSASGYVGNVAPNLKLPFSTSMLHPQAVVTVAVTEKQVYVEGKSVEMIKPSDLTSQKLLLPTLYTSLKKEANKGLQIEKLSHGANPFKGKMMIQGDKAIPFRLLEKIMYTAGQAGYNTMNLEVLHKAS